MDGGPQKKSQERETKAPQVGPSDEGDRPNPRRDLWT